jgi:hypothetical protein
MVNCRGRLSLGCQLCQMAPQTSEHALVKQLELGHALRVTKLLPAKLPVEVTCPAKRQDLLYKTPDLMGARRQ